MHRSKKEIAVLIITMTVLFAVLAVSFYISVNPFSSNVPRIILPDASAEIKDSSLDTGGKDVKTQNAEEYYKKLEITADNVKSVIAAIKRPQTYSCEMTSSIYYDGKSSRTKRLCYKDGAYAKTEVLNSAGIPQTHIITGKEYSFIWQAGKTGYYAGRNGEFSADDVQAIPTYEDILHIPQESIRKAEYETVDGQGCVYVEFQDAETQYIEQYWVSTDSGLLVKCRTYDGEELIYGADMDKLKYDVNGEVFRLANGKMAQQVESELISGD